MLVDKPSKYYEVIVVGGGHAGSFQDGMFYVVDFAEIKCNWEDVL
jgi:hypothetical protein